MGFAYCYKLHTLGGCIHLPFGYNSVELLQVDVIYRAYYKKTKGIIMNDKALYIQKIEAEIKEWKAQIELFKTKSLTATADVKISMNENIKVFEAKVEEAKVKLAELVKSTESTFDSMKKTFETKWEIIKTAIVDTTKKLNA